MTPPHPTRRLGRRRWPALRSAARRIGRRWLAWRFRHFDPDNEPAREAKVAGLKLRVLPDVFNPSLHFTSSFFVSYLKQSGMIRSNTTVLDLGTGSGVLAIAAALCGAESVVAVDINPAAVECARLNARRFGLGRVISVRQGDMFEPVEGERFDLVLCNPPYLRGEPQSPAGYAYWGGDNLEWLARFAAQLHGRLSPGGVAMLSIGDVADLYGIIEILQLSGWRVDEVARRDMLFEIIHLFRLAGEFDFAG